MSVITTWVLLENQSKLPVCNLNDWFSTY